MDGSEFVCVLNVCFDRNHYYAVMLSQTFILAVHSGGIFAFSLNACILLIAGSSYICLRF